MNTYTYTIYDGDPLESGPCEWPSHTEIKLRATSPGNALRRAHGLGWGRDHHTREWLDNAVGPDPHVPRIAVRVPAVPAADGGW